MLFMYYFVDDALFPRTRRHFCTVAVDSFTYSNFFSSKLKPANLNKLHTVRQKTRTRFCFCVCIKSAESCKSHESALAHTTRVEGTPVNFRR